MIYDSTGINANWINNDYFINDLYPENITEFVIIAPSDLVVNVEI